MMSCSMESPSCFVAFLLLTFMQLTAVHSRPSSNSNFLSRFKDASWWLEGSADLGAARTQRNTLDSISRGWQRSEPDALKRVFLKNSTVVCNDGSRAGYYIRKYPGSKVWLVYLEGGWYCFDGPSCESRWITTNTLMSSKHWQEYHIPSGILSGSADENPIFSKANIVFLPYCSSDVWTGTASKIKGQKFAFMGSLILKEVIKALLPRGLMKARKVMMTGSSAGGTGVLLNIDAVSDQLKQAGCKATVKGLVDSGWFLDTEPFGSTECVDPKRCSAVAGLKKGMTLWNSELPSECRNDFASNPWKCFFGGPVHRTLKTPVFVAQYLYDEAQLMAGNVFVPRTRAQGIHVQQLRQDLMASLRNVSAVFAPACVGHVMLTDKNWTKVSVKGVTFGTALGCWWNDEDPLKQLFTSSLRSQTENDMVNDGPSSSKCDAAKLRRCRRRLKRQRALRMGKEHIKKCRCKGVRSAKNSAPVQPVLSRSRRSPPNLRIYPLSRWTGKLSFCLQHLIEECKLPNCNAQCPQNYDNFSGKPIDFEQMLRNAGVKSSSPIEDIFS